ncbi:MAG: hypothetical protein JWR26_2012 [Pedosphaera sp.]|nr:hypothetical protein [Pedosphaera sp.]
MDPGPACGTGLLSYRPSGALEARVYGVWSGEKIFKLFWRLDHRCPTPLFITGGMNIQNSSWCLRTATMGAKGTGPFTARRRSESPACGTLQRKTECQQARVRWKLWRGALQRKTECQQNGGWVARWGLGFSWALGEVKLLRPGTGARRCKGGLAVSVDAHASCGAMSGAGRDGVFHSDGCRAKERQTWGIYSEKGGLSFVPQGQAGPRSAGHPSDAVGFRRVGRGFDFFHRVLADGHHADGGVCTRETMARRRSEAMAWRFARLEGEILAKRKGDLMA